MTTEAIEQCDLLLAKKNFKSALDIAQEAVYKSNPESPEYKDNRLLLFYMFMERGDAANAVEVLKTIEKYQTIENEQSLLDVYVNLVEAIEGFYHDKKFSEGLKAVQEAKQTAPMSRKLQEMEAQCLIGTQRYKEAKEIILKLPKDNAETFRLLGVAELFLKRYDTALLFLTKAHTLDPDSEDYRAEKLNAEIYVQNIDNTQKLYLSHQSYLWNDKCMYKFHMQRGKLFSNELDYNEVIVDFSKAIKIRLTPQALADREKCLLKVQADGNCDKDCESSSQQNKSTETKDVENVQHTALNSQEKVTEIVQQCNHCEIPATSLKSTTNDTPNSTSDDTPNSTSDDTPNSTSDDSGLAEMERQKGLEIDFDSLATRLAIKRALKLYKECEFSSCFEKLTALKVRMNGATAFPKETFIKVTQIKNLLDDSLSFHDDLSLFNKANFMANEALVVDREHPNIRNFLILHRARICYNFNKFEEARKEIQKIPNNTPMVWTQKSTELYLKCLRAELIAKKQI